MPTVETIIQGFSVRTDQGSLGYCSVTLVRGSRNILVDAAQVGRRQLLLQKLAEKGLTPDDIDVVFLTHGHWDHVLNVDLFPNATMLIHPLEREYIRKPHKNDWATPAYTSMVLESYELQEVQEGKEIDEGVRVVDAPGHSRGSMALLVNTPDGVAAITGDALVSAWSIRTGLPRLIFWDEQQARNSIRGLIEQAQLFYPGHDRPFRLEGSRVRYLESTGISFTGFPDPDEAEGGSGLAYRLESPTEALRILPPR
jgi:N-acyl homoserine lactone hydrolase